MPLKTLLVSVGLAKPKGFVSEMVMDAFIGLVISLTGQTDEVSILFNIREGFKKKKGNFNLGSVSQLQTATPKSLNIVAKNKCTK